MPDHDLTQPTSISPPARATAEHPARRERFIRGMRLGIPVFLGYMPVGMAFGVLARTLGFTTFEAIVCSATALAGAGQFIALSLLAGGSGVAATLAATSVVNLRYVLFGTTLSTHLKRVRFPTDAWLAFTLTDETFAINISDQRQRTATPASMAGVGAVSWTGWVLGTVIGAAGAAWIGDPSRWGVEFAMPAMFTALFIALAENRRQVITGISAAAIALLLPLLGRLGLEVEPSWTIIIASMGAAAVAAVVFSHES